MEEWLAQMGWSAANSGDPTFRRGSCQSHIDVTLASARVLRKIVKWEVTYSNPYTNHGNIYMEVETDHRASDVMPTRRILRTSSLRELLHKNDWKREENIYGAVIRMFKESTVLGEETPARAAYC